MLNFNFRPIESSDMLTILEWSNDPETRKQSFNPSPISIEEHEAWFSRKLIAMTSKQCFFYMLEKNNIPIGSIRLDSVNDTDSTYIISYMISPDFRGFGFGSQIIKSLIELLDEGSIIQKPIYLSAYVKHSNIASQKCFQKLNFKETRFANEFTSNDIKYTYIIK